MYLDRNYNDTLGLLHEDAYADSKPYDIPGIDKELIEVPVLTPVDLAVSKLARISDEDREDIELLAKKASLIQIRCANEQSMRCKGTWGVQRQHERRSASPVDWWTP